MTTPTPFASVKLPAALVQQARAAARLRDAVLKASTDGTLQTHIRQIVEDNQQLAKPKAAA